MARILVTGGSGFIAEYVLLELLGTEHEIRTTVRSPQRESDVRAVLRSAGASPARLGTLDFFVADLTQDKGWHEAVAGCDYVLHLASPFPAVQPQDENELIIPAREGTLRVLRAARDAGVERLVLTSSFAAIGYGYPKDAGPFDESYWSKIEGTDARAYIKSKTLAERAAWDFIAAEGGALELSVVNPVGVMGPVLGKDFAASIGLVQGMLHGAIPACPELYFGVVDVRDVAHLHIKAMTHPQAKGERFLAASGDSLAMIDIARILRRELGAAAKKAPKRQLPGALVRFLALWKPGLAASVGELGKRKHLNTSKARDVLGWRPRSAEEAIVATAKSLQKLGLAPQG